MLKKLTVLLLVSWLLIAATACNTIRGNTQEPVSSPVPSALVSPSAAPSHSPVTLLNGYATFEDTVAGYRIQYPERLLLLSSGLAEEVKEETLELLPAELKSSVDLNSIQAIWFDLESLDFATNMNLVVTSAPALTQVLLKNAAMIKELEAQIKEMNALMVDDFTIIEEMNGRTIGNNYYLIYKGSYTLQGKKIYVTQALSAGEGNMYTVSLTTDVEDTTKAMPEFETMLSTLEFIPKVL